MRALVTRKKCAVANTCAPAVLSITGTRELCQTATTALHHTTGRYPHLLPKRTSFDKSGKHCYNHVNNPGHHTADKMQIPGAHPQPVTTPPQLATWHREVQMREHRYVWALGDSFRHLHQYAVHHMCRAALL